MFCIRNPIFGDRRFNCPRVILKPVLESGSIMEQAILQFCSIFESRVHSVPVYHCNTITPLQYHNTIAVAL